MAKSKIVYAARLNLSGLWSRKPVRMKWNDELGFDPSKERGKTILIM